jgi:hypothetical protein
MENLQLNLGSYQLALAVSQNDGEHFVALKPLCEALGLDWEAQRKRTQRNPQFSTPVHMNGSWAQDGKNRDMLCIPVRQVGMWLCTINANRVSEHVRPKLLAFQEQLQVVIHDHLTGRLTMEKLQQMEQMINHLYALVESQAAEIRQLKLTSGRHMSVEASCAGKQLAAARYNKKLLN